MKLIDFLLHETEVDELCLICDPYVISTVWIDNEDLFAKYIHPDLRYKEVKSWKYGDLPVKSFDGKYNKDVTSRYIYIGE